MEVVSPTKKEGAMPNAVVQCLRVSLVATLAFAAAPTLGAPAQRTFVASNGSDAHPCSIALPCRGFAAAIAQTTQGGEVIVLDSAGYGPATIAKSVSIIAPAGIYAGVSVASGNGLTINAGPDALVVLRGLTINGQGFGVGVSATLTGGARLHVENCVISGLDMGLHASASGGALFVTDTAVRENTHHGIDLTGFPLQVVLERVDVKRNKGDGVHVQDGPDVSIGDSLITKNGGSGAYASISAGSLAKLSVQSSRITFNGSAGVAGFVLDGGSVILTVADSNVSENASAGLTTISLNGDAVVAARGNTFDNDFGAVYSNATGGHTVVTIKDNLIHYQNADAIEIAGPGFVTIAGNAISLNAGGVKISGGGVVRSAGNNLFNDNAADVEFGGALTPILLK